MITDKELVAYFERLYADKAVYLWGANAEIITKALTDKLYSWFGSATYNKAYYDGKLKEGQGRIGADCSGAFKPMSGTDLTAQAYYHQCKESGSIVKIPRDKVCLVFHKNLSGKITHIGLYCGNDYTIEMKSSKDNCVKQKLNPLRWTYYGIPTWIDYVKVNPYPEPTETIFKGCKGVVVKWVQWELVQDGFKLDFDGDCGSKTDKAIRDYQRKHKLAIDGRVGKITIAEMKK
jgi:hypothetical protein